MGEAVERRGTMEMRSTDVFTRARESKHESSGLESEELGLGWEESRSLHHKPPSHTLVQFPGAEGIGILAGQITSEYLLDSY